MSFRLLTTRLYKHGRLFVQCYFKRDINILDNGRLRSISSELKAGSGLQQHEWSRFREGPQNLRTNGLLRLGSQARRIFVDNVLNRVTNPYSAELRAQATKRLMFGDSAPFLALVGISLASGDGMLTKDDQLEAVCWEIRNAVARFQSKVSEQDLEKHLDGELGLNNLDVGPPLAKGCSAVVYAAALKGKQKQSSTTSMLGSSEEINLTTTRVQLMSPMQDVGRSMHEFGSSMDNLRVSFTETRNFYPNVHLSLQRSLYEIAHDSIPQTVLKSESLTEDKRKTPKDIRVHFNSSTFSKQRSRILSDAIDEYVDRRSTTSGVTTTLLEYNLQASLEQYPLALKMMFNYDIQSNAMAILRAMHKETVPAKRRNPTEMDNWEKSLMEQTVFLPPHPNIVEMYGVFCDQVPELHMSSSLYPMALPQRLNPQGYGRNMSLFLLMKRYNCNLQNYLHHANSLDMRTRILLFSQLLEAVAHVNRYGVAHRDLKSDNILIEMRPDMPPTLVLSDFGCCIADKTNGLQIPYTSSEIDKGGNTALMAPEIINKHPGTFSVLNYIKSDLWACGAIAYEIFGSPNPFYGSKSTPTPLKSSNYKETELPQLDTEVPLIVRKLIKNMLSRNVTERLSADVAANVMQLFLWSPSSWMKANFNPSSNEILQWLLSLTTKILCEGRLQASSETMGRRTYTEYLLISSFLVRAKIRRIKQALDWIHVMQ
ncbi:serine/threonine-protein kinase Pink1, mitochondrial isoform X2 [Topomyia yanbarensis]|uniref:serine/threonine-protein kinase Pink1, mitochondrial isoform X2 n=1 Tax=Topomyia yanbarensis TaxID=2498891 RepID=UPI00273C2B6E|nr:serine/threonine-protein kinase Pink1, mitochondrial isoform X2 [Topomyia yanbarensis]